MSTSPGNSEIITHDIELSLVDPQGEPTTIKTDFVYDPSDPYAVTMVLHSGAQDVRWTFDRALLVHGRYEPTGGGDVHIWPCLSEDGQAVTIIDLRSPDGELLIQGMSRALSEFTRAMLDAVPLDSESKFLNFDDELTQLLSA